MVVEPDVGVNKTGGVIGAKDMASGFGSSTGVHIRL